MNVVIASLAATVEDVNVFQLVAIVQSFVDACVIRITFSHQQWGLLKKKTC